MKIHPQLFENAACLLIEMLVFCALSNDLNISDMPVESLKLI